MESKLRNIVLQQISDTEQPIESLHNCIYHIIAEDYIARIKFQVEEAVSKHQYSKVGKHIIVTGRIDATNFSTSVQRIKHTLPNPHIRILNSAFDRVVSNDIIIAKGSDDIDVRILSGISPILKSRVSFSFGRKCESSLAMRTTAHWKSTYSMLKHLADLEGIHIESYEFVYGQDEKDTRAYAAWGSTIFVHQGTAKDGEIVTWQYSSESTPSVRIQISYTYSFDC